MLLGISPYGLSLDDYVGLAVEAEAAGFESIWVPDHYVVPERIESPFPYSPDGDSGMRPDTAMFDAWVLLSFMAAATSTLKLGPFVCVLPIRHPFVTAKSAGSLQILSGGRLLLGVGVGWLAEEYEAMGEDFATRGPRTTEAIAVMRALWSKEVVVWDGDHYAFPGMGMAPRPGRVPVLVGGHSKPAIRRAAQIGDGWLGSPRPAAVLEDHLRETVPALEAALAAADRPREGFEITGGVLGVPDAATLAAAEAAGLDRLIVSPFPVRPSRPSLAEAAEDLQAIAAAAREVGAAA